MRHPEIIQVAGVQTLDEIRVLLLVVNLVATTTGFCKLRAAIILCDEAVNGIKGRDDFVDASSQVGVRFPG